MRNKFEILNDRIKNVFHISILLLLITLSFVLPIFVLIFGWNDVGFGFIITIIIFGGVDIYLLRLLLWNIFGKEVYIIKDDTLEFYNDYKYFKDNRIIIKLKDCQFKKNMLKDSNKGYFIIENKVNDLKSSILLDEKKLNDLVYKFTEILISL